MAKELYVGHISDNASEQDIRKLFSVMGTVTSIHLIIDPETRDFKRCGSERRAADVDPKDVAETLDGAYLIDQIITVSIARPQKPGMSKSKGTRKPWMKPKPAAEKNPGQKPRNSSGSQKAARPSRPAATQAAAPSKPARPRETSGKPSRQPGKTR